MTKTVGKFFPTGRITEVNLLPHLVLRKRVKKIPFPDSLNYWKKARLFRCFRKNCWRFTLKIVNCTSGFTYSSRGFLERPWGVKTSCFTSGFHEKHLKKKKTHTHLNICYCLFLVVVASLLLRAQLEKLQLKLLCTARQKTKK